MDTLSKLKPEIDNLRIAWDFAVTSEDCELLRGASGALYYFYELHQLFQEAEALFCRVVEMAQNRLSSLGSSITANEKSRLEGTLADMQTRQAFFIQRMGRSQEALHLYSANLDRLKNLDEPFTTAYTYIFHGIVSLAIGDLKEARHKFLQGLPLTATFEHPWLMTIGLCFLAETEYGQGNYDEAYSQFSEAMALCEATKDPYITLLIGTLFSRTAQMMGRMTKAEDLLHESLRIARESGNRWGIGLGLEQMAALAQAKGDLDKARPMLEESVSLHREVGDMWSLSRALNALSRLSLSQLDLTNAERSALDASRSAVSGEYYSNALEALATLANVHARQGKSLPALELALFVQGYPASTQNAKEHATSLRAELESQFTPQQIEVAQAYVQSISLETVIQSLPST